MRKLLSWPKAESVQQAMPALSAHSWSGAATVSLLLSSPRVLSRDSKDSVSSHHAMKLSFLSLNWRLLRQIWARLIRLQKATLEILAGSFTVVSSTSLSILLIEKVLS
jgi:hypothetical protein